MKVLIDHYWPGNVRELQNVIERAVTLSAGGTLAADDIHLDKPRQRAPAEQSTALPEGMTLEQWEEEMIRTALARDKGNKSQAARALGLSRNALRYRLSKMGVADPAD
jgi:two-component system response regulator PilR (NtrC family)